MAEAHAQIMTKAPFELAGEFVSAVMRQEYHDALVLCQALLMLEPDNETYLEFENVLREAKLGDLINKSFEKGDNLTDSDDSSSDDDNVDDDDDDDDDEDDNDLSYDSSDSGNSDSSGDIGVDNNKSDDTSDSEDSDNNDDDDLVEDIPAGDLANLNLLVGGLRINRR